MRCNGHAGALRTTCMGLDRGTVAKVLRQAQPDPKPAKAPSGSVAGIRTTTVTTGPTPANAASERGRDCRAI